MPRWYPPDRAARKGTPETRSDSASGSAFLLLGGRCPIRRRDGRGRGRAIHRKPRPVPAGPPPMPTPPLVSLRNAGRQVGGRWVWRGLDVAVHPGDRLAVRGASGAGKTLLLRALAGLDALDEGVNRQAAMI